MLKHTVFDQKAISIFFISHRKVEFVVLQIAKAAEKSTGQTV